MDHSALKIFERIIITKNMYTYSIAGPDKKYRKRKLYNTQHAVKSFIGLQIISLWF